MLCFYFNSLFLVDRMLFFCSKCIQSWLARDESLCRTISLHLPIVKDGEEHSLCEKEPKNHLDLLEWLCQSI